MPTLTLFSPDLSSRGKKLLQIPERSGGIVESVSDAILRKITDTKTPQGIVMLFAKPMNKEQKASNLALIFDRLSDPGNMGTLLRSARAFGVQAVLVGSGCADVWSPKTLRSAMGAHFHLWIEEANDNEIIEWCRAHNLDIVLADMHGVPCWKANLIRPLALVIGGESNGAGEILKAASIENIAVPMPAGSESLNASVAGSIILYEIAKQRAV